MNALLTKFLHLLLFAAFLYTPFTLHAQWEQTQGPEGGNVYEIILHNGRLWAATQGGLYFSDDMAEHWQFHPVVSKRDAVTSIHAFNGKLFLISAVFINGEDNIYQKNLFVSSDNGQNWDKVFSYEDYFPFLTEDKLSHIDGKLCLQNIFSTFIKSADEGITWDTITSPIPYVDFFHTDQSIIAESSFEGIYISQDCGESWQLLADTVGGILDIVDFKGNNILSEKYDFTNNKYLTYLSTDLGQNWTLLQPPPSNMNNGIGYGFWGINHDTLWARSNAYYFSTDGGQQWQNWDVWGDRLILPQIPTAEGGFSSIYGQGVSYFDKVTKTWQPKNKGLIAETVYSLHSSGPYLFAKCNTQIFGSINEGDTWTLVTENPKIVYEDYGFYVKGDTFFLRTDDEILFATQFGANGWKTFYELPNIKNATITLIGNYFHCANLKTPTADIGLLDARTGEMQFFNKPLNSTPSYNNYFLKINNRLVYSDNDGTVWISNNAGQTWIQTLAQFLPGNNTANRLNIVQNKIYLSTRQGMHRSDDFGLTWVYSDWNGLPIEDKYNYGPINSLVAVDNVLFVSIPYEGVYFSADFGQNWTAYNTALGNPRGRSLVVHGQHLFLGTSTSGVWRRLNDLNFYTGKVYLDNNQNNLFDAGDAPLAGALVKTQVINDYTNTLQDGTFNIYANSGSPDTIRLASLPSFATSTPAYHETGSSGGAGLDFAVYLTPNIADLNIDLTNTTPFNRGFLNTLLLKIKNNGSFAQAPLVKLSLSPYLEFLDAAPTPSNQTTDTLYWQLPDLAPFASTTIVVNTKTLVTAPIDSIVHLTATVSPFINDVTMGDNVSVLTQRVVGAYDPNDKQVFPANNLPPDLISQGQPLTYTVRFQNTGNYPATFVRIIDTLSENLDISTLQVLSASHSFTWKLQDRKVLDFFFDMINLPDSSADEAASHGFVKYRIEPNKTLPLGAKINNTAHIYFDFNRPITTNTTQNVVAELVLTHTPENITPLSIVPNPANQSVTLRWKTAQGGTLELLNAAGKRVLQQKIASGATSTLVTIDTLPEGLYFIRFSGNTEHLFGKLIITH